MRFIQFCLIFLFTLLIFNNCQKPDPAVEEQKIKEAVEKETQAFLDNNFTAWTSTYVHAPYSQILGVDKNSLTEIIGWQAMHDSIRKYIKGDPKPSDTKIIRKNFIIRNYGTGAWVTYDQWWGIDPDQNPDFRPAKQLRVLEKVDGEWKVIFMGHISRWEYFAPKNE